jgi:hypothetical protein
MGDFPTIHERVGRAIGSSHLEQSEAACDIDKITALGMAGRRSRIGALLLRFLAGQDEFAFRPLVGAVVSTIRARSLPFDRRVSIALQALHEVVDERCSVCHGRGHIQAGNGVIHVCWSCEGVGVNRYSDRARARFYRVNLTIYRERYEGPTTRAVSLLRKEFETVGQVAREKLRRAIDTACERAYRERT